jgi:hypothetical protein
LVGKVLSNLDIFSIKVKRENDKGKKEFKKIFILNTLKY